MEARRPIENRPTPRPALLFAGCLAAWVAPALLTRSFFAGAELQPPWTELAASASALALFLVLLGAAVSIHVTRTCLALLTADVAGAPAAETSEGVRRVLSRIPGIVGAGVLAVAIGATVLLLRSGPPDAMVWSLGDVVLAVVFLVGLGGLILQPLLLVCAYEFGRCFGHVLQEAPLVPAWLSTASGLVMVALLGGTIAAGSFMSADGPDPGLRIQLLTLLPFALAVMLLAARQERSAVRSLSRFTELGTRSRALSGGDVHPISLDALGLAHARVADLLHRLQDSEARLRATADAACDFSLETDAALRVTWASEGLEAITGMAAPDLVGRTLANCAAALGVTLTREQQDHLWNGGAFRDFGVDVVDAEGVNRRVRLSGVPEFDRYDLFAGYRCVGSDFTNFASAEERLRERDAQLAQAQKMEAVGQLTGGVAHDFNNLLMVVTGNLELALEEADAEQRRECIESAQDAADRGATLIRHLLAFSRREVLRPEPTALDERMEGLSALVRTTLGERIPLQVDLEEGLQRVLVDVAHFESAVLNLAINARDAMPKGGRLRITAHNLTLEDATQELAPGDYVEVCVEDTGEGMTPQVRARVFEPFFSTKEFGRGSGLGLSMVYGFAKQSGGGVHIESTRGVGTRVVLRLPAAAPPPREAAGGNTVALPRRRPQRGQRVLMIEDEDEVRRALARGLEAAGFEVLAAADTDAALELVEQGSPFDLVLSDVVLPGALSGPELVVRLRRDRPGLPCLMMSGHTDDLVDHSIPELRDVELLTKPFQIRELVVQLDVLLGPDPAKAPDPAGLAGSSRG